MLNLSAVLPYFQDELEKIAKASLSQKVDEHHRAEKKDWSAFEQSLKSPRFVAEVKRHPESDEKLKAYTEVNNKFARSKNVVMRLPSSASGAMHTIKKLPDGRLGCSCKDWQYKHSWGGGECKHIRAAKSSLEKKASALRELARNPLVRAAVRGSNAPRLYEKSKKIEHHGREM